MQMIEIQSYSGQSLTIAGSTTSNILVDSIVTIKQKSTVFSAACTFGCVDLRDFAHQLKLMHRDLNPAYHACLWSLKGIFVLTIRPKIHGQLILEASLNRNNDMQKDYFHLRMEIDQTHLEPIIKQAISLSYSEASA
jgi:hypothetical protein